ncbi:MAG: hypothetical protein IPK28_15595 [Devosia sp.]|nr:hypothetical protein [Devosia sp.]
MSALPGRMVAVSVGDAPDRARLGYPQREVDRALLSICTALVRAGAEIAYGGHLDPEGYTFKIFRHLAGAYAGSRDPPFRHFVPEPVARAIRYGDLLAVLNEGRGVVRMEIACGDAFIPVRPGGGGIRLGDEVVSDDVQFERWFAAVAPRTPPEGFATARRMMSARVDARVVILSGPDARHRGRSDRHARSGQTAGRPRRIRRRGAGCCDCFGAARRGTCGAARRAECQIWTFD